MDGCSVKIPLLVVAGPTAVGKTTCAIELARRVNGEIVCADSMQIYRYLNIGTAKPTAQERRAVPHHMVDFLSPSVRYSVADYVLRANAVIDDIVARGKMPVLCGGTGLYISSLVHGVRFAPQSDAGTETLRRELYALYEKEGIEPLMQVLWQKDPRLAAEVHPNNVKRVIRSLERLHGTQQTTSDIHEASVKLPSRYNAHIAVLYDKDRESLYARIAERVDSMVACGLFDEARYVYENRERFVTAAQAIGYKELFAFFDGKSSKEPCMEALKQSTRRYAKRQLSWLRREQAAVWYDTGTLQGEDLYVCILNDFASQTP